MIDMKRYILILFFLFIPLTCLGKEINLESDIYTNIIRKEKDDFTIFEVNNNISSINITKKELKKILSQKSNSYDNPLAVYSILNINSDEKYYIAINDSWVSDLSYYIKPSDYAKFDNSIFIYNYSISYRKDSKSNWLNSVPSDFSLYNSSLEEKLSFLLGISKDRVVGEYNKLFKFRVLPSGYIHKIRLDLYKKKSSTLPIQVDSNLYLAKSLELVDTKYIIIKHNRVEPMKSVILHNKEYNINIFSLSLFLLAIILTIILGEKYKKTYNLGI